jgi:hypothetical protein
MLTGRHRRQCPIPTFVRTVNARKRTRPRPSLRILMEIIFRCSTFITRTGAVSFCLRLCRGGEERQVDFGFFADPDSQWCWANYVSFRAMQQADNVRNQLKRSMEKLDLFVPSARYLPLLPADPPTHYPLGISCQPRSRTNPTTTTFVKPSHVASSCMSRIARETRMGTSPSRITRWWDCIPRPGWIIIQSGCCTMVGSLARSVFSFLDLVDEELIS